MSTGTETFEASDDDDGHHHDDSPALARSPAASPDLEREPEHGS